MRTAGEEFNRFRAENGRETKTPVVAGVGGTELEASLLHRVGLRFFFGLGGGF